MELFVMKSAKAKVLAYLSKDSDYNTLTVAKMQSVFGIANGLGDFVREPDNSQVQRLNRVGNYIPRKGRV